MLDSVRQDTGGTSIAPSRYGTGVWTQRTVGTASRTRVGYPILSLTLFLSLSHYGRRGKAGWKLL